MQVLEARGRGGPAGAGERRPRRPAVLRGTHGRREPSEWELNAAPLPETPLHSSGPLMLRSALHNATPPDLLHCSNAPARPWSLTSPAQPPAPAAGCGSRSTARTAARMASKTATTASSRPSRVSSRSPRRRTASLIP